MIRLLVLTFLTGLLQASTVLALSAPLPPADKVTYAEQIAPLVYGHCSMCHRPGTAAPFSLLSYNDVRKHARTMLRAMSTHFMPPWQPAPGWGEFVGARSLSDEQIGLFKSWVDNGMPEGDPQKTPKAPEFSGGWQMGKPDQVFTMDKDFVVPADGPDIYQNFVIPLNLKENKWVTGIEFQASSPAVVHHVLYFLDNSGRGRKLQAKHSAPGKPGFPGMGFAPTGSLGGWAVGDIPAKLPQGLARPLSKDSDLVLQTHFHPTGTEEKCRLTVALYYSDKPSPRTLIQGMLFPPNFGIYSGLDIPPGKADYTLRDSFTLPADVDLVGVNAHAHYVGKSFKGVAVLPDGTTKNLFLIKDWDFNWQGTYYYKDFIRLPKGTKINVEIVYDNSAENPRNPHSPPIRIGWGEGTTDEMGSLIFITVPAKERDVPALRLAVRAHIKAAMDKAIKEGYKLPEGAIPEKAKEKPKAEKGQARTGATAGFTVSALTQLPIEMPDISGKLQQPLSTGRNKANVLFFITNDCPISNGYAPEIGSIVKAYAEKGIGFYVVQVDPDLSTEDARKHAKLYNLPCPVVIDRKHELVKATGVTITPEVAVMMPGGTLAYRGRIDDQYPGLGKKRIAPAERNLREALNAIVAGTPVKVARTEAVGCSISDLP
jgi:hypothetical protein